MPPSSKYVIHYDMVNQTQKSMNVSITKFNTEHRILFELNVAYLGRGVSSPMTDSVATPMPLTIRVLPIPFHKVVKL